MQIYHVTIDKMAGVQYVAYLEGSRDVLTSLQVTLTSHKTLPLHEHNSPHVTAGHHPGLPPLSNCSRWDPFHSRVITSLISVFSLSLLPQHAQSTADGMALTDNNAHSTKTSAAAFCESL